METITRYQWRGDHLGAEHWASQILEECTGRVPDSAVFMGDCHGIYIDPERLSEHGVTSRYQRQVLVKHGEVIEWTGAEFVVTTMTALPSTAPVLTETWA